MHDRGSDTTTRAKTMWSESLFEGLYLALKKGKKNDAIMAILRDIKAKQYKDHYIIGRQKGTLARRRARGLRRCSLASLFLASPLPVLPRGPRRALAASASGRQARPIRRGPGPRKNAPNRVCSPE